MIDSAAEVTVMSSEFALLLKDSVRYKGSVSLQGAMGNKDTVARCARDVSIQIKEDKVTWNVYVADICEDFILGLDFLLHFGTTIDFRDYTLLFKNNIIPVQLCKTDKEEYQVSRVLVSRRYVVPPETALRIICRLESPINNMYTFQPNRKYTKVLFPNTVHSPGGAFFDLVVLNDSVRYVTLKKDHILGSAIEVESVIENNDEAGKKIYDEGVPDLRR